jgi:phenylacetate-CoA ligase
MCRNTHRIRFIEQAFQTPVCDRYGCEETSIIACEKPNQSGLFLATENVYCEISPDSSLSLEDNQGRLLITDLTNKAMPLIRYQVGDVVETTDEPSRCGSQVPRFAKVLGREADYVLTPEGKLISGISLTENFAMHISGTAQLQIIQDKLNLLRLRLVRSDEFSPKSYEQINQLVQELFGPEMKYEIEFIETIPQETNGKYRFCISPVAVEYLRNLA